jgi:hypothetical protein
VKPLCVEASPLITTEIREGVPLNAEVSSAETPKARQLASIATQRITLIILKKFFFIYTFPFV